MTPYPLLQPKVYFRVAHIKNTVFAVDMKRYIFQKRLCLMQLTFMKAIKAIEHTRISEFLINKRANLFKNIELSNTVEGFMHFRPTLNHK